MKKSCLILCHGYLGDHMFASSIAKKLKEENQFDKVDYVIGFPRIQSFFKRNPYIDEIFLNQSIGPNTSNSKIDTSKYNSVFTLKALSFIEEPAVEMQKICGVLQPTPEFTLYTDPETDDKMFHFLNNLKREYPGIPLIAIMNNWQPKAFSFTEEEYNRGIDVPYLGYGGRLRNIPKIVQSLEENYLTILVGGGSELNQFNPNIGTYRSLDEEASILRYCDYFVGAEGGLANLASGVGCKTILTQEFVWQLYGPNGVLKKINQPKLGPRFYFKDVNHVDLDLYLTDDEIIKRMTDIINNKQLTPYGVSIYNYENAKEAMGFTYTTSDGNCPPTPFFFDSNPFKNEMKSAKNILEIGCGIGRNLSILMENTNAHYWGLDPNKKMVKYFWEIQDPKWKDRVTICNDFNEFPADLKFDVVISTFVMQHIGFRPPADQMNVLDISKMVMNFTQNGTIWFVFEHEREEQWQQKWLDELEIIPEYYFKPGGNPFGGGTIASPEFENMTHRGNDNNIIIFKEKKVI